MPRAAKLKNGLTIKQDRFVREYIKDGNAVRAYLAAYNCKPDIKPATVDRKARALLAEDLITAEIASLQERLRDAAQVTAESLTAELEADRRLAREIKAPGAAIQATRAIMELHGLQASPRQNDRGPVSDWSPDRIKAALQAVEAIRKAKQAEGEQPCERSEQPLTEVKSNG